MNRKKLMILGAGRYQMPIIEKAKERGLYIITVSPRGNYPGLQHADFVLDADIRDEEKILRAAKELRIDGIVTDQTDMAVRTLAYVSSKLNLPGIDYECARLFTDKALMRKKCEELGLPTIKSIMTDDLKDVKEFFTENGRAPLIIKPVDNQGSRGVFLAIKDEDFDEMIPGARSYSGSGRVIAEEYIDGTEHEVDSVVFDYEEKPVACGDVKGFDISGVFASRRRTYPTALGETAKRRLIEYNSAIITGFGLKQGITHSEYIIDHSGQPRLIEAAARGGGAFVSSHIVKLQSGIDTAEYLIDLALGEVDEMPDTEEELCSCCCINFYLPKGEVISIDGIEKAKAMPSVYKHSLDDIEVGMETGKIEDKTQRYVTVLRADSPQELEAEASKFKDTIRVMVNTAHGTEGPVWE